MQQQQKSANICLKFNRIIDANTNFHQLLSEVGPNVKRKNGEEFVSPMNYKTKKQEEAVQFSFSFAEDVSAKLVLEKLLEECVSTGTELIALVLNYLSEEFKNIVFQYANNLDFKRKTNEIVTFIEVLLTSNRLSKQDITNLIQSISETEDLPLYAISKLSKLEVFSFVKILNRIKGSQKVNRLLEDCLHFIFEEEYDESKEIVNSFIKTLVTISYCLSTDDYISLQDCSNKLLKELGHKILNFMEEDPANENQNMENASNPKTLMNIYELILNDSIIDTGALEQFLTNQLITLLTYRPEVPLSTVIKEQEKWRSTRANKNISNSMFSIIVGIGHTLAFNTLDSVVSSLEVNWSYILTFLSTLLLSHSESSTKLRGLIDCYIRKGCSSNEIEFLILGFLFARHASQEGRHIFPSYSQWFGALFGSENSSPANNKKSFLFLFQFLTDLVPYENPSRLRAHIHQSIFVPKGCQKIIRDYQHLARAQIQHLTNHLDQDSIENSVNVLGSEEKQKILEEIECALKQFEMLGKIPSFVAEASIFKRSYFLKSFLPLLLLPRELPIPPDSKMKFIEELLHLDKISRKDYNIYLEGCKNISKTPIIVVNDNSDLNCKPLSSVSNLLDLIVKWHEENQSSAPLRESEILNLFSQLSSQLEKLTALADLKFANVSPLTMIENYHPNVLLYQIVKEILKFSHRLIEILSKIDNIVQALNKSNYLTQLISLITVSPALQLELITTLINNLMSFEENKLSEDQLKLYGICLAELKKIDGMFLPVMMSGNNNNQSLRIVDFIISRLPLNTTKQCIISCFILYEMFKWTYYFCDEKDAHNNFQEAYCLYTFLSSRLVTMETGCQILDITYTSSKGHCSRTGILAKKIPLCCKYFVERKPQLNYIKLEDWLNFELETPWSCTSISSKIGHLQFWLYEFMREKKQNSSDGFLTIFRLLLQKNSNSINAAEMLILLQGLMLSDNCSKLCFIEEWKNWKKSIYQQDDCYSENIVYKTKLLGFMSLCRCLPHEKFFYIPNLLQCSLLLREFVFDIMECEGTLYLSFVNTLYIFEALVKTAKDLEVSSTYIQQCFHPIKDSVLFHWKSLKKIIGNTYEPLFERFLISCKFLIEIEPDRPLTWKLLAPKDFGTFFISYISNEDLDTKTISNLSADIDVNYQLITLWKCISFFGNIVLSGGVASTLPSCLIEETKIDENASIISDDEMEGNQTRILVKENELHEGILSVCSFILNQIKLVDSVNILSLFKTECASFEYAWKCTLVGLNFVLLDMLSSTKIQVLNREQVASLLTLLICCFNSLSKLFESESWEESNFSYLIKVNKEILSLIQKIPNKILVLVPSTVINNCDSEMKCLINRLKS